MTAETDLVDLRSCLKLFEEYKADGVGHYGAAVGIEMSPLDGAACLYIHPCKTHELMSMLGDAPKHLYLQSFWSLYSEMFR